MEFFPLIVECHKRENRELYASLCNGESVLFTKIIFLNVSLVFVSQDNWSGTVIGEGDENPIGSREENTIVSPSS